MKYRVYIEEKVSYTVDLEADSEGDAEQAAITLLTEDGASEFEFNGVSERSAYAEAIE